MNREDRLEDQSIGGFAVGHSRRGACQRRWGLAGVVSAATLGIGLMMAASEPSRHFRATGLEIVDGNGKIKLSLKVDDKGRPVVQMFGENGEPQVVLGLNGSDRGALLMSDPAGRRNISLDSDLNGSFVTVFDKDDTRSLAVGTNYQTGSFLLFDNQHPESGKSQMTLSRDVNGTRIELSDKSGKSKLITPTSP